MFLFQVPVSSNFRGVIDFFGRIGLYDVILPFILVFTIVFAILEKTRVLGYDEEHGHKMPKKNLNSMAAFVIAFLVVASTNLVAIINKAAAQIAVILIAIVLFMLLVGALFKEGIPAHLWGGWRTTFMILSLIGVALIFLNAMGWLDTIWEFLSQGGRGTEAVGAVVLLVIVVAFMSYTVTDYYHKRKSAPGEEDGPSDHGGGSHH